MKDFARSAARSTRSSRRSRSPRPVRKGIATILGVGVAVAGAWILLSTFHWSDMFGRRSDATVALITEKVEQSGAYVGRFSFENRRIQLFPVPSDLPVEVMGGYGTYRFQAMYPLLVLEEKEPSYRRSTMSLSVGTLLDEIWTVSVSELSVQSRGGLLRALTQSFWQNDHIPLGERLAFLALAADRRTEVVVRSPVRELPAPELADMSGGAHSLCTVALINTTQLSGLAGRIAHLLESEGFRVVRTVSDSTQKEVTTVVTGDELSPDCRNVQGKLELLVPGKTEHQHDQAETLRNRADLVVQLGTDLAH